MIDTQIRIQQRFNREIESLQRRTDHVFFWLFLAQWLFAIVCAFLISPKSWTGAEAGVHQHVEAAIFLGGALVSLPCWLIYRQRVSSVQTRWIVAFSQMLYAALLIHLMGGRIEAHFYIFVSLAILSFYRDRSVYIPAVGVVVVDHLARGMLWPESVFGVVTPGIARAIEHAAYCLFETAFLLWGIQQSRRHVMKMSQLSVSLEDQQHDLEQRVEDRTKDLSQSQNFLQTILDSLPVEICILDGAGQIINTNLGWKQFGLSNGGTSDGGNYLEVCRSATGECRKNALELATAIEEIITSGQGQYHSEYECHSPHQESWFQASVSPIHLADSTGAVVVHMCITERVLIQREIQRKREEAERLAMVAEYTDNAVVITDASCRILWTNDGFTRTTGYRLDEVIGRVPGSFLQGEDTDPETVIEMRRALKEQKGFDVEIVNYNRHGKPYWANIEVRPIRDEKGVVQKYIAIESNITEKKERESSLKLLRNALDNASDVVLLADVEGFFVDGNRAANEFLGVDRQQLLQKSIWDILCPMRGMDTAQLAKWKESTNFEASVIDADGQSRVVDVWSTAFYDGIDQFHCWFLRDASARLKSEADLARLNEDLQRTARNAGMAEIATGVLHNVGNILNSVNVSANSLVKCNAGNYLGRLERLIETIDQSSQSFVEFVQSDDRGPQIPRYLDAIAHSIRQEKDQFQSEISELIENVAHIKEVVAVQQTMAKQGGVSQSISASGVVRDALVAVKGAVSDNGIDIHVDIKEDATFVSDKHRILQILVNLIKNSVDAITEANKSQPRLMVQVEVVEEDVAIRVEDNGIGINEEMLDRIFQHGVTTKDDGHGFGLHASANTAQQLGGSLTAFSDGDGKGACFELRLPLTQERMEVTVAS